MNEIAENLLRFKEITTYLEKIKEKISPVTLLGLSGVSKACIINATYEKEKRP